MTADSVASCDAELVVVGAVGAASSDSFATVWYALDVV